MNTLPILIRREFWEYRSLWQAPLWAAGLLLLAILMGLLGLARVQIGDGASDQLNVVGGTLTGSVMGPAALLMLVGSTVIGSYLLDCLYAERRDRSILFWKSLPVSDERTVLTKFLVALVIVPLGVYAVEVLTHLVGALMLLSLRGSWSFMVEGWTVGGWLRAQGSLLGSILVTLLWYAPYAAYLMLGSVYARRAPMLTVILPPLVLGMGERLIFGTSHISVFLFQRLAPVAHPIEGLMRPGLWLGLVLTAAMLWGVVRLRRYRDDT